MDEASGYRFYSPDQLERARLVAWLRRAGMPLARISAVCDLPPAAAEVTAFLRAAEADFAERKGLAHFLISYLSGKGTAMPASSPLAIRCAAASDIGRMRDRNQDAGSRLLCSDGLTSVVPAAVIRKTLSEPGLAPDTVVRKLIELANAAGGPDNIACVVADVTEAA